MAEEFQPSNWWKTTKSSGGNGRGFDGGSPAASTISCSTVITDATGAPFPWAGGSGRPLMDSTLQLSGFSVSPPSTDWSQTLLASGSGRAENSFHALLQDELSSRPTFSPAIGTGESSSVQLKDMNNPFFIENSIPPGVSFPHASPSPPSSSMIHVLFDPDSRTEQSLFDAQQMVNYQQSHMINQQQQSAMINQLQFTNNTPFWNASASSQPFDLIMKSSEGGREKRGSSEPAMKKVRAEQTSPSPTFKVRKEKLGDRITALQQLVSPFGKTDTASVLHEAIVYIKFLHDQVSVLSNPYLKNAHPMHQEQQSTDKSMDEGEQQSQNLRSRGLCLVPISSTYPVASETTADFWTPSFGGTYR